MRFYGSTRWPATVSQHPCRIYAKVCFEGRGKLSVLFPTTGGICAPFAIHGTTASIFSPALPPSSRKSAYLAPPPPRTTPPPPTTTPRRYNGDRIVSVRTEPQDREDDPPNMVRRGNNAVLSYAWLWVFNISCVMTFFAWQFWPNASLFEL